MNKIAPIIPLFAALGFLIPTVGAMACPDHDTIRETANAFSSKSPGPGYPNGTPLDDGYCAQAKYLELLGDRLGPQVGYKAGLTNKKLQERFGASEPVGGVVFEEMLQPSGSEITTDSGVRLFYEADLIVTVTDERINSARTHGEVIQYLGEVIPFLEILDIVVAEGETLNLATIIGYNVVSRTGVIGKGIPVQPTQEFINALGKIESLTVDQTGQEIQRAQGSDMIGHPLNVVIWLIQHLEAQGKQLKPRDVLSLGAMGTFRPVEAGQTITVHYTGLPTGDSKATVTFR